MSPLRRRTAAELQAEFGASWIEPLMSAGYICAGPERAHGRLVGAQAADVGRDGAGSPWIERTRALLASVDVDAIAANALMLIAPHLHWPPGLIVETYSAKSGRYELGPGQAFASALPISFVFTPDGAVPFEWAAESVPLDEHDAMRVYALIEALAAKLQREVVLPWPVGVALNHCFKRLFEPPLYSTMELPDHDSGLAHIVPNTFSDMTAETFNGQVAWSPIRPAALEPGDRAAVAFLERSLARLGVDDARSVFRLLSE